MRPRIRTSRPLPAAPVEGLEGRVLLCSATIALDGTHVAEDLSAGATVGSLSTAGAGRKDVFTFAFLQTGGDPGDPSFAIDGNQLKTAAAFDFEAQNSYTIRIAATNQFHEQVTQEFVITVDDVNEAPTGLALTGSTVTESSPQDALVGMLSSSDPDAGDTATYTLAAGEGDTNNSLFKIAGNELQVAGSIDYGANPTCSVRVAVTDSGGLSYEKTFSIAVQPVVVPVVINGTSAADTINLDADGTDFVANVNGTITRYLMVRVASLTIYGFEGSDNITVGPGVIGTTIFGGAGRDTLIGGSGDDVIYGQGGADLINGRGGNDSLYGNGGSDLIFGRAGDDSVVGGRGADTLNGSAGNDVIYGGLGADVLYGRAGDDYLNGQGGNDFIFGNDGADTLVGGFGSDALYGGTGDDFIKATDPNGSIFVDTISGGDGNDNCIYAAQDTILADVETSILV